MRDRTPTRTCGLCGGLSDQECASQKYGAPEHDTYLPEAAGRLEVTRDFRPLSSRKHQIRRCPECGTYYLYESDYEYLANGTEDEERLTRLTAARAAEYLESGA